MFYASGTLKNSPDFNTTKLNIQILKIFVVLDAVYYRPNGNNMIKKND